MGEGFVTQITVPGGVKGLPPVLVAMYPESLWPRYGGPVAMYSDYTLRNEAGVVVWDGYVEMPGRVFTGGGIDSREYARYPDGTPLRVSAGDPRASGTTGGNVPGEKPNTDPLYIAGVMPPEPVYDDWRNGGWGAPIAPGGPPSSWSSRDARWVWPDGRITDAQQRVLGTTHDQHQAARELQDRGATPSIVWSGTQVIYSAPAPNPGELVTVTTPGGGTQTVDGTGRVVSSSPPGGTDVQTLFSPAAPAPSGWAGTEEAAGSPAPIVLVKPKPVSGALVPTNSVTGAPLTDSTPGTGGGTTVAPTSAIEVTGAPGNGAINAASEVSADLRVPTWALYLAGAALLAYLFGRR